jgi:hypothetical protein
MAAQYGKMAKRDVIPPWAETMVSYAGCHPAGGSKRLRFLDLKERPSILSETPCTCMFHELTCSAPTVLIGLHLYRLLINLGMNELKRRSQIVK